MPNDNNIEIEQQTFYNYNVEGRSYTVLYCSETLHCSDLLECGGDEE